MKKQATRRSLSDYKIILRVMRLIEYAADQVELESKERSVGDFYGHELEIVAVKPIHPEDHEKGSLLFQTYVDDWLQPTVWISPIDEALEKYSELLYDTVVKKCSERPIMYCTDVESSVDMLGRRKYWLDCKTGKKIYNKKQLKI
jgi:hypothetical protein